MSARGDGRMMDFGFYNMDCMDGMKQFPDKFFDLAIVDPPYGDGGVADSLEKQGSANGSTVINRGGWHGKQKYHLGTPTKEELPETRRNMGLSELGGHGRRNTEKNHYVGHCPETRVF